MRKLFTKVVIVASGIGIGPVPGHLLDSAVPARLVWVTKNPRLTYGDALLDVRSYLGFLSDGRTLATALHYTVGRQKP